MSPQNSPVAALIISVAGLITVPSVAPPLPDVQVREIRLTGGGTADSPLGDGTALVCDGCGVPVPPPQHVEAVETLYLRPLGFTRTSRDPRSASVMPEDEHR